MNTESPQNGIVSSIQKSVIRLVKRPLNGLTVDSVLKQVRNDPILSQKTKSMICNYSSNPAVHSTILLTFAESLIVVWSTIQNHPDNIEIKKILDAAFKDEKCLSLTGQIARLVDCLNGFDPAIQYEISDSEYIANIIILVKYRLESVGLYSIEKHRSEALVDRGYDLDLINAWVDKI